MICPVDSVILFLNNWAQGCSVLSYSQMQEIPGLKKSPWLVLQDSQILHLGRSLLRLASFFLTKK